MRTLIAIMLAVVPLVSFAEETREAAGCWYHGDGLGVNLTVTLLEDGSYTIGWEGCLGNYGTASGTWSIAGDRIALQPGEESGMLAEQPIRALYLVRQGEDLFLCTPENYPSVEREGANELNSYRSVECSVRTSAPN